MMVLDARIDTDALARVNVGRCCDVVLHSARLVIVWAACAPCGVVEVMVRVVAAVDVHACVEWIVARRRAGGKGHGRSEGQHEHRSGQKAASSARHAPSNFADY